MRFLCIHGRGTNAKVKRILSLKAAIPTDDGSGERFSNYKQATRLRQEFEDHEFVFIDGLVSTGPGPGADAVSDEYYGFFEPDVASSVDGYLKLLTSLVDYVHSSGPFDGIMGFSEGAIVAAMLLVEDARRTFAGFQCAIFFSGVPPPNVTPGGMIRGVDATDDDPHICIPTAHMWSDCSPQVQEDLRLLTPLAPLFDQNADSSTLHESLARLCDEKSREVFQHNLGHEVPGAKSTHGLAGTVRAMERTIERARQQAL